MGEWSKQGETMQGTIVIRRERGYEHVWVLVTDLEPAAVKAAWYQMRFWIENEYKDQKRGGCALGIHENDRSQTGRTTLVGDGRGYAARGAVGGSPGSAGTGQYPAKQHKRPGRPPKAQKRPRGRTQSCLARDQQAILAASLKGEPLLPTEVVAAPGQHVPFPLRRPRPVSVRSKETTHNVIEPPMATNKSVGRTPGRFSLLPIGKPV